MTDDKKLIAKEALAKDAAVVKARMERQSRIATDRNPLPRVDYLCLLTGWTITEQVAIELRYVPGKLLLTQAALQTYLTGLPEPSSLESLAAMILDDLNNELVPRFVQIRVRETGAVSGADHAVLMEDRRPRWDNPALLARLPRF